MGFLLALDAGHGRYTPGKRIPVYLDEKETREWVLNDRICRYISARAEEYEDFAAIRVDDETGETDVSLRERCRRANEADADLYLSCHHNAGISGGSGGGVVAYCIRGGVEAKLWRDILYEAVTAAGGLTGNRTEPKGEKNFDVLVYSHMPAVLVEFGFMDSSADVPVILSEAYARQTGFAVADAVALRMGLKRRSKGFSDVPERAWYWSAVDFCSRRGLMVGTEEGLFQPDRPVTRGELAAVVQRIMEQV